MSVYLEGQQDDEGEVFNGQQRVGQYREQGGGCRGWFVRDWGIYGVLGYIVRLFSYFQCQIREFCSYFLFNLGVESFRVKERFKFVFFTGFLFFGFLVFGKWVKRSLQKLFLQQQKYIWGFFSVVIYFCLEVYNFLYIFLIEGCEIFWSLFS